VRDRDRKRCKEIFMNMLPRIEVRNSMRLELMVNGRVMARMFGITLATPKTVTISRTMRRGKEKQRIS